MASLYSVHNSNMVLGIICRGLKALAGRNMVWLCKPANLPVHTFTLVFSVVHLDTIFMAGITNQIETDPDAS